LSTLDDLLDELFDNRPATLRAEFAGWARGSRRFAAFAGHYRAKIRAKLRQAGDEDSRRDLRAELETAALLLRDERFTVEYEKYAAAKQRGPDFTVTFKTHTPFNVEVRRLRVMEWENDPAARATRLVFVLSDKVGQMPPSIINLLWLSVDGRLTQDEVTVAVTALRQQAERKDDAFFARRGFMGAADFQARFRRLSGIVTRQSSGNAVWLNPTARHKLLPEIATAIGRLSI
jgi:hypothetical protein